MLHTKQDSDLIEYIKANSPEASDSIEELSSRHGGIITSVVTKYSKSLSNTGIYPNDLLKDREFLIWKSAQSYNHSSKYTTWLYYHTKFHCLNAINKERKKSEFIDNFIPDKYSHDEDQAEIIRIAEDYIMNLQDERAKTILMMKFFETNSDGKPFKMKDIEKRVGITSQYCYNIINYHLAKIKSLITKYAQS